MDQTSLDEMLNDEPSEIPTLPEETEAEAEARIRDEKGRFAKKGEEEGAPPAPANEFDGAATVAERRKRQEAEDRIRALEQQLQSLHNPPAPPPSVFEDENGAFNHYGNQVVQQAVQTASINATLNTSEMLARREHADFEDIKAEFLELAAQNPALREQALSDPHPWEKAYQIASNARALKELGSTNVNDLREQIRAEIQAEMQGQAPARPGLPPTLTTERNMGSRSGPSWAGPTSLSDMLK